VGGFKGVELRAGGDNGLGYTMEGGMIWSGESVRVGMR